MNVERALLSQLLQDNQVYYTVSPQDWWFTEPINLHIFKAFKAALEDGSADAVSVGMATGKPSEVSDIADFAPSTKNAKYYAEQCKQEGQKHELAKLSAVITDSVRQDKPVDTVALIDEAVERVFLDGQEYRIEKISDKLHDFVDMVETRVKLKGELPGFQTGLYNLDLITGGLQGARLYVIGARPSQGKSAIMLNMAEYISRERKVGILSLESSITEVLAREVSMISGIDSKRITSGSLKQSDFSKIIDAGESITKGGLYIYDKPNLHLPELVGQARRMVRKIGCECLFVDYLQLIQVAGAENDRQRVARASTRLKDLSRELNTPIVALAQLRRDSDGRRPGLGDFQHSSQIEQDADVGMLLHWAVVDEHGKQLSKSKAEGHESYRIYMHVDKNRDGATGTQELEFNAPTLRFTERIR